MITIYQAQNFTLALPLHEKNKENQSNIENLGVTHFCELWKIFNNIYFSKACQGPPLKSKIFTGVSFRKILGFYYKRNMRLVYFVGTASYIPLRILERVNRVIFQNSSEFLLLKYPSRQKHVQSWQQRSVSGMIFRCVYN